MGYSTEPVSLFVERLGSKDPTPGGGGASALVGAVGVALGNMVASLTIGKKKYAAVELDMLDIKAKASNLQAELLTLIERDAELFQPLLDAYAMPHSTEEEKELRAKKQEKALRNACSVPLQIMEKVCNAIDLIEEVAEKGTVLSISDAGDAAVFCKAALQGASLNVFINTRTMKDREYADRTNQRAEDMLEEYCPKADAIFENVRSRLR